MTVATQQIDDTLRRNGRWLSVEAPGERWLRPGLGGLGLWKGYGDRAAFEIPATVTEYCDDADGEETVATGIEQLEAWCVASLAGDVPVGWMAPSEAELRAIARADDWSIQAGPHVRPIALVCEAGRIALHLELVTAVSDGLSKPRQAWITNLVEATSNRRRLVRLHLQSGPQRTSIIAEIDLTGCPRQWYAALLPLSLAALRHVAAEMLPTLSLLCDPHVHCDAWEQSLS